MNISIKRKRLYIESDNLNEIESHQLIGWTPNYLKGYASMNLDIQALCNLLKQTSEKPEATEEVKTWYQKEIEKNKLALNQKRANLYNLNKELKEYQLEAVNYFLNVRNCIIGYDMGLGKVQPIDSRVLTENGWKPIGELYIGEKIYNSKGTLSNVIGIYPQGTIKNYEIIFSDGSKTNCGLNHLWNVQTPNWRKRTPDKYVTKTLKELLDEGIQTKHWHTRDKKYYYNNKWFIPLIKPIQWKNKNHIIHPYNLGLLIGDGGLTNCVILYNEDKEIQEKFIKLSNCGVNRITDKLVCLKENPYKFELQRLGLWKHTALFKFIPYEYLHDSIENRISLLQGLMDTDGTVHNSNVSYSTSSKQLSENIKYLVQSLGGTSRINIKIVKDTTYYNVNIQLPPEIIPFTTKYHLDRYKHKIKYKPLRAIQAVKYINNCEGVCIKTDSEDSLYITDEFILTHNTIIGINCIKAIKAYKTMIVCPSYLKYSWGEEIEKWCPKLTYTIIDGTPEQREQQFKKHQEQKRIILIINYEQIRVKTKKNGKVIEINVHEYIQKTKFDLVIWDEAHRLKTRDSQISKGAYAINTTNRLMLTGTPLTKNPGEIYSLLKILDRERFTSYWTFVKYYCDVHEGFRNVLEIGHVIRPKEFQQLINRYMIRKLKEDVASELPDKIYMNVPVYMNDKQTKYYNDALEDYLNPSGDIIESDVEKFIRICQIAQNPVILGGHDVSCVKNATINLCDDIGEQRIMVACTYIEMSKNLQKSLENKYPGRNIYLINSQVRNRHEIVEKFKENNTGILVTTIKCLAEGANLDCCDYIIYADIEWNYGVNLQFENRIHRMTSTRTKFYYFMIVEKTIHQYKHNKIMSEKQSAKAALGDSDSKVIKRIMEDFRKELT